jgi:hypothetical protein
MARCVMRRLSLILALMLLLVSWAWSQQRGSALLPLSNEIPGWTRVDTPEVAIGKIALCDWIDGPCECFSDSSNTQLFVEAWRQIYEGPMPGGTRDTIRYAWTFDQTDSAHCDMVYHAPCSGSGVPWTDSGHAGWEARIDTTGLWAYRIDFWKGKFFCRVDINDIYPKRDTALAIAKRFAQKMSDKILLTGVEEGSLATKPLVPFGFTSVRRNPSRGGCTVEFSLSAPGWARVSVYDAQGRFLRELVQGTLFTGKHRLYWDGKDGDGLLTGSGVYFLRLVTEGRTASAKLVVVR